MIVGECLPFHRPNALFAALSIAAALGLEVGVARAQSVTIDMSPAGRQQTIDGFGTCLSGVDAQNDWFKNLYFDDMGCSLLRMDLTPPFVSPYSDNHYNSPWFGQTPSIDNGGPEGNYVRT